MKKIYSRPETEVFKMRVDLVCTSPGYDPNSEYNPDEPIESRRRTFLDSDDADWDLGF